MQGRSLSLSQPITHCIVLQHSRTPLFLLRSHPLQTPDPTRICYVIGCTIASSLSIHTFALSSSRSFISRQETTMKQKHHNYFTIAANPTSANPKITSMAGGAVKPISQENPENEMKFEDKISISHQNFVSVYLYLNSETSIAKYTRLSSS